MKQKDSSTVVSYLWKSLFFRENYREQVLFWTPTNTVMKSEVVGLGMMLLSTLHIVKEENEQQLMHFPPPPNPILLKGYQMYN